MRNIGKMEHLVLLESKTEANVGGSVQATYADEGSVWAEIIESKGSAALDAARESAKDMVRVRIHYRDDVSTGWRMTWNGRKYYIRHLDKTSRRSGDLWMTVEASSGRDQA